MVHRGPATGPSRSWCRSPAPRARRAWPGVLRSSWLRAATRRGSPARSDRAGDRTARGCRRRTARTCSASSRHLGTHRLSSGARRRRARSTEAFPCLPLGSARSTGPSACCGRSRPRAGRTIVRPRSMGTRPIERSTARCHVRHQRLGRRSLARVEEGWVAHDHGDTHGLLVRVGLSEPTMFAEQEAVVGQVDHDRVPRAIAQVVEDVGDTVIQRAHRVRHLREAAVGVVDLVARRGGHVARIAGSSP